MKENPGLVGPGLLCGCVFLFPVVLFSCVVFLIKLKPPFFSCSTLILLLKLELLVLLVLLSKSSKFPC